MQGLLLATTLVIALPIVESFRAVSISLGSRSCIYSTAISKRSRSSAIVKCNVEQAGLSERTRIGTLDVPTMGMGTLNWPLDKKEDKNAEEALRSYLEAGVNFLDTAEAYGFGTSEILTRNSIAAAGGNAVVATKFAPVPWRQKAEDVVDACKASASRLGVESIDLYQIHWPDIIQPFKVFGLEKRKDEIYWDGLARCYELGLVKNVGVSNYGPEMVARAHTELAKRGVPLVSNQINFSLLYRKQGSQATVDRCNELGIKVLGYFPLANGLLAGKYGPGQPGGLKGLTMRKYVDGGVTQGGVTYPPGGASPLIQEMRKVGDKYGKSVAQVAINYAMAKGVIPIPGCRNAAMARENLGARGWRLAPGDVTALEAAADALGFEFSGGGFRLE